MKPIVRNSDFIIWDDSQIVPGQQWRDEISKALKSSKVIVLLVSQHFIASDFIYEQELPEIIEAYERSEVQIFWIHLSASTYHHTKLNGIQAAHDPTKPLASLSKHKVDEILVAISKKLNLPTKKK